MLPKALGRLISSVHFRHYAVPYHTVRACVRALCSLCLYLETGKVCRSKSLRKAGLNPLLYDVRVRPL